MPVMKRMLVIAALLLIPAALAWGSQVLTRPAGSPEIGDASVTVSVVPTTTRVRRRRPPGRSSEVRPEPEPESRPHRRSPTRRHPRPPCSGPGSRSGWSDVARQPLPTPQVDWDDDWDDDDLGDDDLSDDGDSGDDDWDDDDD